MKNEQTKCFKCSETLQIGTQGSRRWKVRFQSSMSVLQRNISFTKEHLNDIKKKYSINIRNFRSYTDSNQIFVLLVQVLVHLLPESTQLRQP